MKKIFVAGASGYLGGYIARELQSADRAFVALGRSKNKLEDKGINPANILVGEVTQPATLKGLMQDVDVVISTVGITRQKDGQTYMDVDYQANINLLNEAKSAGVKKFIYISAINGDKMKHLKIMEAKEKFVDELKASCLDYTIIRPNGFFSDMKDFLDMAKSGRVYLFGDGEYKLNPIHGQDLAAVVIDAVQGNEKEVIVGGPDILTQNEISRLALKAVNKPIKISHLPDWIRRWTIRLLRLATNSKTYGPTEFFLTMMAQDNIGPRHGVHRLEYFFRKEMDRIHV